MPQTTVDASLPSRSLASNESEAREPVALELIGVFLALFGLLLLAAVVTLAPEGSPRPLSNVTGAVGRAIAEPLTLALGVGAHVLAAFPILWGVSFLKGRRPSSLGRKSLMAPVFATFLAVLASLVVRKIPVAGLVRSGPGGYVGVAFGSVLYHLVGRAGSLVAFGMTLASLLLATDLRVSAALTRLGLGRKRRRSSSSMLDGLRAPAATGTAVADEDATEDAEDADGAKEREDDGTDESDGRFLRGAEDDDAFEPSDVHASGGDDGATGFSSGRGFDDDELGGLADANSSDADLDAALREATADEPPASPPKAIVATGHTAAPAAAPAVRRSAPRRSGTYDFPPTILLEKGESVDPATVRGEIERNAAVLATTLRSFGVETRVVSQRRGPVITFYELALEAGTRINKVATLDRDLAVALKAESVRVVAPIPGKDTIGIEVPNTIRDAVRLRDLIEENGEKIGRRAIPLFLGKDAMGEPIVEDLAAMPHMLIAGTTGSGKSVCVNSVLLSILMTRTPDEVKVILIDPKQVELSFFEGIPHLLTPVVTNMKKAAQILEWAVAKMEQRYDLLLRSGVRNIAGYNQLGAEKVMKVRDEHGYDEADAPELMPYVVIVVDELADLMLQHGKDVEIAIIRLAAKSRAVGIHLLVATQRPSVDVITGLIKSNMPMRMSFKVSSMIDSRVILDHKGAEKLLGKGDMLLIPPGTSVPKRAQGTFIADIEVKDIVEFSKKTGPAEYVDILGENSNELPDPMLEDDMYDDAVEAVLATELGSASMLQRRFSIGYTRASRLIDMMCDHKVVGPHKGSKARELLMTLEEWQSARATKASQKPVITEALDPGAGSDPGENASMGASDEADGIAPTGSSRDAASVDSPWS